MKRSQAPLYLSDKQHADFTSSFAKTKTRCRSLVPPRSPSNARRLSLNKQSSPVSKSSKEQSKNQINSESTSATAARVLFQQEASTSQPAVSTRNAKELQQAAPVDTPLVLTMKRLVAGAFAGVVSRSVVAPLDVAKLKFMLDRKAGAASGGILQILQKTFRDEGVKGLFRGNGLNCCRVAPGKAIELCAFETIRALTGRADLAGGAAGALNTLATYPLEVLRTRVALNPAQAKGGVVTALRRISQDEGKKALYRGVGFSVAGVIPYTAAQYVVYDLLCHSYKSVTNKNEVPPQFTMAFGSIAAVAASACTFPLEVYRRQLQLGGGTNAVALQTMKGMVAQGGVAGLYRGLGASCLKLAPAAGVSFACFEAAKTVLRIGVPPPPMPKPEACPQELEDSAFDESLHAVPV